MKFTVDGKVYNVFVTELSRRIRVVESNLSDYVKSGEYFRDMVGSYCDYEMTLGTDRLSPTDYDDLVEVLSDPKESHTVVLPYGRSTLEFEAYIEDISDNLKSDRNGEKNWTDLSVGFYAKKPYRRPSE